MSLSSLFILKSIRIFQSMTLGFFTHWEENISQRSHLGCQRTVLKELNSLHHIFIDMSWDKHKHWKKNMECLNHFSFPRSKWLLEYSLHKLPNYKLEQEQVLEFWFHTTDLWFYGGKNGSNRKFSPNNPVLLSALISDWVYLLGAHSEEIWSLSRPVCLNKTIVLPLVCDKR